MYPCLSNLIQKKYVIDRLPIDDYCIKWEYTFYTKNRI